jgi:hypothetical protein
LILLISEVHPFHAAPPETVSVDIVTPEQVQEQINEQIKEQETKAEEPAKEKPPPDLKLPKLDFTNNDTSQHQQASPRPQQPQPQPSQLPKRREANAQSQPSQAQRPQSEPAPQPPAAMPQAAPSAYQPPEPDVTIKYGVMLGLPAGVAPNDNLRIRLRAVFATDGTLARPPILIEAPPSAKGAVLVKAAITVLQDCQPYKMLPLDKYEEWKVMDLPFTPQDFGG